ncbi:histidine phosphatase family protein [Ileibacterium valens]|uniref:histidine phosphatase family protein n=1 Tax=Ileibacterium valens TaxID=1862668 RepID=UPI0024BB948B|nr:histidine phosphatase family protein [Ileibacterium valens]
MKKLYILRHGQTLFNQKEMVQGQCDSRLTDLGIRQSDAAGQYFKDQNIRFDSVYTSDLPRTEETLEQFYTGPHERRKGFRERSYGVYEGDSNLSLINIMANAKNAYGVLGIETDDSLVKRMKETLEEVMDQPGNDTVLVVSHGDIMRTFADWVDEKKMSEYGFMPNCAIFEYDYDEKTKTFDLIGVIDQHVADMKAETPWKNFKKNEE